jgi:hypothetical protein
MSILDSQVQDPRSLWVPLGCGKVSISILPPVSKDREVRRKEEKGKKKLRVRDDI